MQQERFVKMIAVLEAYYGYKLQKNIGLMQMYWSALKRLSDKDIEIAFKNIRDTFRPTSQVPFPLIPHFLEAIGDTGQHRAQKALSALKEAIANYGAYQTVDFGDKVLHAVIDRFGGWVEICQWQKHDWDINEGRFLKAYETANLNPDNGPEKLIGIFEHENRLAGYDGFIPAAIKIQGLDRPELEDKKFKSIENKLTDKLTIEEK